MRTATVVFVVGITLASYTSSLGEDWPQWRGPARDDVSLETDLLEKWPANGPDRVWLFENAGAGYSGFSISNGKLFTMGTRDDATVLLALNADTGEELWTAKVSHILDDNWGNGPRATPTVDGDHVYAMSGTGDLVCTTVDTGKVLWRKSMETDFGGERPQWGYTESVLVDGNKVVCTPGNDDGAIVALDKRTGETIWKSEEVSDGAQYASIVPFELDGQRQYVQLFMKRVVGVSADDGSLLWEAPFDGAVAVIPTPVCHDKKVYVCAGYGVGCKLVDLSSGTPQELYANKAMKNHHGGVILVNGRLFGHSDKTGWVCQDFQSGEMLWNERGKLGKGADRLRGREALLHRRKRWYGLSC